MTPKDKERTLKTAGKVLAPVVAAGAVAGWGAITAFASAAVPVIAVGAIAVVLLSDDN